MNSGDQQVERHAQLEPAHERHVLGPARPQQREGEQHEDAADPEQRSPGRGPAAPLGGERQRQEEWQPQGGREEPALPE
jgi:hypothetical protein